MGLGFRVWVQGCSLAGDFGLGRMLEKAAWVFVAPF